jgi:hypothetical protein
MASQNVILFGVGQQKWPRWMIFDAVEKRYWSKGTWKKRRRNGDLWHDKAEAERELQAVRSWS